MKPRLWLLVICAALATPLQAGQERFNNPKVGKYALDYCRVWGKECGKPAADAYCRKRGYSKAIKFGVQKDKPPTRVIHGGKVCNEPYCDRISWVACLAKTYDNPKLKGHKLPPYPLDYCRDWGKNCGKPAADAYCQSRGHTRSVSFKVKKDTPPTRVIRGRMVCDDAKCDLISSVTCGPKKRPSPPTVRGGVGADSGGEQDEAGDTGVYED